MYYNEDTPHTSIYRNVPVKENTEFDIYHKVEHTMYITQQLNMVCWTYLNISNYLFKRLWHIFSLLKLYNTHAFVVLLVFSVRSDGMRWNTIAENITNQAARMW